MMLLFRSTNVVQARLPLLQQELLEKKELACTTFVLRKMNVYQPPVGQENSVWCFNYITKMDLAEMLPSGTFVRLYVLPSEVRIRHCASHFSKMSAGWKFFHGNHTVNSEYFDLLNFRMLGTFELSHAWHFVRPLTAADSLTSFELSGRIFFLVQKWPRTKYTKINYIWNIWIQVQ